MTNKINSTEGPYDWEEATLAEEIEAAFSAQELEADPVASKEYQDFAEAQDVDEFEQSYKEYEQALLENNGVEPEVI